MTITTLLVEGRRVRWDSVVREGTWLEDESDIQALTHPGTAAEAAIHLRASTAFAFALPSPRGRIQLERDGRPLKEIDLSTRPTAMWRDEIVFDFGSPEPPAWTFFAFLVITAAMAWLLAPWRQGRTGDSWIFFHAATLHALVWATQLVGTNRDTIGYVHGVKEFFELKHPGYFPPGTSLLVGLADLFPWGALGSKVTLLQHAMIGLAVLWLYRLLRRSLTREVAFLAGLVLGSSWIVLFMPQGVLSEPLACFGMSGAVYFGALYRDRGGLVSAILAALLAGWAGLARVVPLVATTLAFLCLHLVPFSWSGLRRFALLTGISLAVMAAPVGWYAWHGAERRLTTSVGFHMFNRVVEAQKKLAEDGPTAHALVQALDYEDPRGRDVWEIHATLLKKGFGHVHIRKLFEEVSMEALLDAPGEFALFTLEQAWRQFHADPHANFAWCGDTVSPVPGVESSPVAGFTMSGFEWGTTLMDLYRATFAWLPWLALAGMTLVFFLPQRVYLLALSGLVLGYILATSAGAYVLPRYSAPVAPFLIALAAIPLDLAVRGAMGLWRRRYRVDG